LRAPGLMSDIALGRKSAHCGSVGGLTNRLFRAASPTMGFFAKVLRSFFVFVFRLASVAFRQADLKQFLVNWCSRAGT
jgi:hypothetical protein